MKSNYSTGQVVIELDTCAYKYKYSYKYSIFEYANFCINNRITVSFEVCYVHLKGFIMNYLVP